MNARLSGALRAAATGCTRLANVPQIAEIGEDPIASRNPAAPFPVARSSHGIEVLRYCLAVEAAEYRVLQNASFARLPAPESIT